MSIDLQKFIRSDYNTLINNVEDAPYSRIFKKINLEQPGVTESVQLNDGKYKDPTYLRPRYVGAKTNSSIYSFYTPGDSSYGKTAAIDWDCVKFAWSNNINDVSLNFVDKTLINIRYLIDEKASITELNSRNNNLFEVQNMFKKGDFLHVSLMDKYNPSDQSTIEGNKVIHEGGYRYSPIIFREYNEPLSMLYLDPAGFSSTRFGVKTVSKENLLFRTIGNSDDDFASTPDSNCIFQINGVNQTTPFSLRRISSAFWPYSQINLRTDGPYKKYDGSTFRDPDPRVDSISNYYAIDYFTPNDSGSAAGGYITDNPGYLKVSKTGAEYYAYLEAPRSSEYVISTNIPIRISFGSSPDSGWATFKVVGVLEVQKVGSSSWTFAGSTKMRVLSWPNDTSIAVDERNSAIFLDDSITSSNPYLELECTIDGLSYTLDEGDKIRLKVYLVEMRNFFRSTNDIYFEILAGNASRGFFELYDKAISGYTTYVTGSIPPVSVTEPTFTIGADYRSIRFSNTASLLYEKSRFVEPDPTPPASISRYYSPVEDDFVFEVGDLFRFTSYYNINSDLYEVTRVDRPIIDTNTNTVLQPLVVNFNKSIPTDIVTGRTFAVFRKKEDETSLIINFVKSPGQSSNAIVIPYNLDPKIRKNVGNIIVDLKDSVLSKVLLVS